MDQRSWNRLTRLTGGPLAEDAVQEACLYAIEHGLDLEDDRYMKLIARHRKLDLVRRERNLDGLTEAHIPTARQRASDNVAAAETSLAASRALDALRAGVRPAERKMIDAMINALQLESEEPVDRLDQLMRCLRMDPRERGEGPWHAVNAKVAGATGASPNHLHQMRSRVRAAWKATVAACQ